jgi:hypothetical protein
MAAAAPVAVGAEGGESGEAPPPLSMRLSTTQTEGGPTATATEESAQALQTGMEEEAQQTQQTDVSKQAEEEGVAATAGGPAALPLPSLQQPPSQLFSSFPPPPGLAPLPFGSIFSVGPPQQQQQSQAAPLGLSGSGISPSSSSSSATTTSGIANPLLTQPQLQFMELFKQLRQCYKRAGGRNRRQKHEQLSALLTELTSCCACMTALLFQPR